MLTLRAPTLKGLVLSCKILRDDLWDKYLQNGVRNFLIFFVNQDSLIILWRKRFFRTVKSRKVKYLENHFFKKFPQTVLKILSAQICWTYLFFENFLFSRTWSFFTTEKPLIWAPFFPQKINFVYAFSQRWLFNFNILLKTCFRNFFRKAVKKWWFHFWGANE